MHTILINFGIGSLVPPFGKGLFVLLTVCSPCFLSICNLLQCGGSDVVSVSCFGVRVSVMFHFMFVHYTFSSVWVAEWPPLGK